MILPVKGQKVEDISLSTFEVDLGSRRQEPAGPTDKTTIAARLRHDCRRLKARVRVTLGLKRMASATKGSMPRS